MNIPENNHISKFSQGAQKVCKDAQIDQMKHPNKSWCHFSLFIPVLSKVQNPGSPNGPPIVDSWMVHITFGWSVYAVVRNEDKTLI